MAGLLENYYEFFENEEEDFSSTNDLSSITEQVRIFKLVIRYPFSNFYTLTFLKDRLKQNFL